MRGCAVEGCDRPLTCRGWCGTHYTRWYRHGDPLFVTDRPGPLTEGDNRHGTSTAYNRHGCRCAACGAWNRETQRRNTERRAALLAAGKASPAHGSQATYANWRCRCAPCKAAWSVFMRSQAAKRAAYRAERVAS